MRLISTKRESVDQQFKEIDLLPVEALHLSSNTNFEKDMIKQAFASVAIRGSHQVITFNSDSNLMTTWPLNRETDDDADEDQ